MDDLVTVLMAEYDRRVVELERLRARHEEVVRAWRDLDEEYWDVTPPPIARLLDEMARETIVPTGPKGDQYG